MIKKKQIELAQTLNGGEIQIGDEVILKSLIGKGIHNTVRWEVKRKEEDQFLIQVTQLAETYWFYIHSSEVVPNPYRLFG